MTNGGALRSERRAGGVGLVVGARERVRDARDRLIASDPGGTRLRLGVRAFVAVGSTVLVEWGLAELLGRPPQLSVLLGAVVAMLMSTGIKEGPRRVVAVTAAAAPVVAAIGAALGVVAAQAHLLSLIVFVAVSFLAVWIRRFGPRWFALGFLFWQSYFFALFLHPPVASLPSLLMAVATAGVWVGLLLLTVLHADPQVRLTRTVAALRARARSGIAAALEVLDDPDSEPAARRLRRQLIQLAEVALLLDGQLADEAALPAGVPAGRLRRWIVDVEIGIDGVSGAVRDIAQRRDEVPPAVLTEVRRVLQALGWGHQVAASDAARTLETVDGEKLTAVRRLGAAAAFLLDTVGHWDSGELVSPVPAGTDGTDGTDPLDGDSDFEPVVTLVGGNLPGSAALAEKSLSRPDAARWSPSRMRLTTRQAVQAAAAAALAIAVGEAISPQRFYWAVIAAFIAFAGTATSGELVSKGIGRIVGTLTGLVAAVALANVTDGHPWAAIAAILICIFLAFFLQLVSYTAMVFFITILLGQLYTLLGTFSDGVLVLRLEETVVGALIGILVSLVVLPTHSRATLRIARVSFFTALSDLLDGAAAVAGGHPPARDLLTLTVEVEAAGRQVVQTRRALTKGRLFGADRIQLRHRVSVLGTCGAAARELAATVGDQPPYPGLSEACSALADIARELAAARRLLTVTPVSDPGGSTTAAGRVRTLLDDAVSVLGPVAAIRSARRLNNALELLGA